jgi:single-strand DNA-binding protein
LICTFKINIYLYHCFSKTRGNHIINILKICIDIMLNRVTLIGNLGRDPDVRRLESGAAVAKFPIATNEYYRDKDNQLQQITEWHDVVAWRALAEQAERALKKGGLVYIEGRLTHRKYKTQDGQDRVATEVLASTIKVLDRPKREGGESGFPTEEPPMANIRPTTSNNTDGSSTIPSDMPPPIAEEGDDLPF